MISNGEQKYTEGVRWLTDDIGSRYTLLGVNRYSQNLLIMRKNDDKSLWYKLLFGYDDATLKPLSNNGTANPNRDYLGRVFASTIFEKNIQSNSIIKSSITLGNGSYVPLSFSIAGGPASWGSYIIVTNIFSKIENIFNLNFDVLPVPNLPDFVVHANQQLLANATSWVINGTTHYLFPPGAVILNLKNYVQFYVGNAHDFKSFINAKDVLDVFKDATINNRDSHLAEKWKFILCSDHSIKLKIETTSGADTIIKDNLTFIEFLELYILHGNEQTKAYIYERIDSIARETTSENFSKIIPSASQFNNYVVTYPYEPRAVLANYGTHFRNKKYICLKLDFQIPITYGLNISENLMRRDRISNQIAINQSYATTPSSNWTIFKSFEEAYYFVPLCLARNLIKNGYYEEALDWLITLYDFRQPDETKRVIYQGLGLDDSPSTTELVRNFDTWLLDPLDPHKLGRTRKNAYLKFTVRTIVECLLQYADANFTIDTVESISKAAELYEMAIALLNSDIFNSIPAACAPMADATIEEIICALPVANKGDIEQLKPGIKDLIGRLGSTELAETTLATLKDDMTLNVGTPETFDFYSNVTTAITNLTATVNGQAEAPTLADINEHKDLTKETYTWSANATAEIETVVARATQRAQQNLVQNLAQISGKTETELEEEPEQLEWLNKSLKEEQEETPVPVYDQGSPLAPAGSDQALMFFRTWPNTSQTQMSEYAIPYIPILNQDFCVPANPVYNSLLLWAELNLFKLRNCMNIAGMKRQVDVYAAPTDATSGIPYVGANGQIVLPGTVRIVPTQYRYQYIIQRAKELVSLAQQLEANLLSLLEKKDSESYSLMKAKQDLALARANVKLQDLRIKVSEGEVDLAVLQKERSELQVEGLQDLIDAGLNELEQQMMGVYNEIALLQGEIALGNYINKLNEMFADAVVAAIGDVGAAARFAAATSYGMLGIGLVNLEKKQSLKQSLVQQLSIRAAQARREQEWNFQKTLAEKDVQIGQQGIRVAKDRLRVTGQERQISNLQLGHAEDTVNFLNNKFTNVELYSWMSGVIEGVYAYFLRQATATAKMAQNQLAFERQELPTPFIQDDYWESPANSTALALGDGSSSVDRRGMTGSTRLLQDIYKVDQFAFETDRRKLQLAKTFSLSRMAAIEFQRFRETGEITFETLMEHFDRDFPGHYLRLIKKVNVSIIALVPPVDGVKAMLTSSGISHVVTKGDTFQDTVVRRDPEMIAFTGSQNATGLFELQPDERFANPFEGSGVHMRWQLQLPTDTNLFNFETIADMLVTIEYTALHSYDYQQQVLRKLDPEYSAERSFSFREELPDQFYELNNPDQSDTPMEVSFDVSAFDFPAGVKDVYIKSVKVFYVVDEDKVIGGTVDFPSTKLKLSGAVVSEGDVKPGTSGLISTESGSGSGYLTFIGKQPYGKWTYKLPDDNLVKKLFADEVIRDVIFIIGFGGTVKPRVNP